MTNNRLFAVLSVRPFLFLWLAEIFSQVAMNMVNFMLLIVVYEITGSSTAVSGIVLSFTIPAIFFGIVAGVYVDRFNKKGILFGTNILRAFLLILLSLSHRNLPGIYLLSFFIAVITQFFIPAETPMIPTLVKGEYLLTANALFSMGIYGSIFVAYALSGPFLLFFGTKNAFIILALFFFVSAVLVSLIRQKTKKEERVLSSKQLSIQDEIKTIFHLASKNKEVSRSLFLLTLAQILILVLAVIGPGYARHILGIKIKEFPLLFVTPATLGMLSGAILLGNYLHNRSRSKMAAWGVFLTGITLLVLPYGSRVASRGFVHAINTYLPHILKINILHFMVVLAFVFGFASSLIFVPSNTILQEATSDNFRGKIYGALNALVGLFSLFPIILVGSFADAFGVGSVLTGTGIIVLCIWLFRLILKK